ncbi:TIGR03751 family conjugal transfer lipoprotein [Pseudomonas gingeri]|uniref:TIGR03751 family conjugal transfer lipoprotein n=1 Tax=Pseudomonas gingeri TaxID=117681 RepID=A0A7Y7YD11_9PSED|nr:TIGR03751 family conjugal transfer lipoprotein [Pseudomonas gingeri]NWA02327.1 TIGR03751 family conjugal transfer lipoprotein [Pseudomonas gingeri]NWA12500.1 TIGR03751 family conjugal transfer lipoprotein [Pseudomonas gingeri]NWA57094.1 TIGR03751 family conjugal transfer lipoprotein [Pseudomonas gingeri]NWA93437.1 TIGR03751 family conjugal transfer lipoprotein [Pseudomonas gingeri]NWB02909.1 TIGR03751 family conjugal transfer lipoprotein [Pseudomonas gingeri]
MRLPSIELLPCLLLGTLLVGGCSTDKDHLLPHGPHTMTDIWDRQSAEGPRSPGNNSLQEARLALRRPLGDSVSAQPAYTRTARNEIHSQFRRLPNPDLVLYVFPHLAGSDPVPVPGYSTVFPFYQRVQYALPGERTEDY